MRLAAPSTGTEGQVLGVLEALAHGRAGVVRTPNRAPEYDGLPVADFDGAAELARAMAAVAGAPSAPADELARRFGPQQALEGILAAARRA